MRILVAFVFFSRRRRHTRLTCDWSSDVCSSDLDDRSALRFSAKGKPPAEVDFPLSYCRVCVRPFPIRRYRVKRRLRSRARWLLVLIPAVVLLFWWGLTPYVPGSTHHIGEHLIRFEIDTSPRENAQRVAELHEVLDLLPAHLIEPLGSVKIIVSGAPDLCDHFWASGCAWRDASQIGIHQRSDADAY